MISNRCLVRIKHHEGVRMKPYRCPAKLWTVGVGHVLYPEQGKMPLADRMSFNLKSEDNRVFTAQEVDDILTKDLGKFVRGVARYCPAALDRQNHLDALTSFAFNLGLGTLQRSTLRAKYNRKDYEGAADEFLKYIRGGGKVLRGLVNRRNDERAMFLTRAN